MANTIVTIIFQNSYATPIVRVLIRVISDLKVTCNYLSDLNKILYNEQLEDGEYRGYNYFSKFYASPVFKLLIRVISDLEVNNNYLSGLDEMFHTK